ncbi:hypothetical protein J6590_069898 [Homalodisca vitripennis]|nr:hypothetical protein J6590_069898 [Homalodisca vitripennis]
MKPILRNRNHIATARVTVAAAVLHFILPDLEDTQICVLWKVSFPDIHILPHLQIITANLALYSESLSQQKTFIQAFRRIRLAHGALYHTSAFRSFSNSFLPAAFLIDP